VYSIGKKKVIKIFDVNKRMDLKIGFLKINLFVRNGKNRNDIKEMITRGGRFYNNWEIHFFNISNNRW